MRQVFLILFLLVLPSSSFAYGYQTLNCSCGSADTFANNDLIGVIGLNNSGGMNIFYFASSSDQVTQNIYGNSNKLIRLPVHTDDNGDFSVDVSTNYNNNYTLSCGPCEQDSRLTANTLSLIASLVLGGFAGLGFIYTVGARIF